MKKYKVVKVVSAEAFEISLNELAQEGWKVVNANLTFAGSDKTEPVFFALLVSNDTDTALKELMEENADELNNMDSIGLSPSDN
jgi:hypothetical protein